MPVAVSAALFGATLAMGVASWRDTPVTRALATRCVGTCALILIALVGAGRLWGAGLAPVIWALVLTGVPLALPMFHPRARWRAGRRPPAVDARRAIELDVRGAEFAVLRQSWQITGERVARATGPDELAVLADVRGQCLDEFERRDPSGFAQWLRATEHSRFPSPPTPPQAPTPAPTLGRLSRSRHPRRS